MSPLARVACCILACLVIVVFSARTAQAQVAGTSDRELGVEIQLYPAGLIVTGSYSMTLDERNLLGFHLGGNFTDRRDFGEHDDETGEGPGAGISFRRAFSSLETGWFAGARLDVWRLAIDWEDDRNGARVRGESDVTVLMPTGLVGYRWPNGLALSLAAGSEINLETSGEDVGEGAIGLLGVSYRF